MSYSDKIRKKTMELLEEIHNIKVLTSIYKLVENIHNRVHN